MLTIRVLLIVQAVGAVLAAIPLALFGLLVLAFGGFVVAFFVFVALVGLAAAAVAALVGQQRMAHGDRRWRLAMMGLEVVVILVGTSLLAYLLLPTQSGVPAPPTLNVVLVLVIPVVAAANLALMLFARAGESTSQSSGSAL